MRLVHVLVPAGVLFASVALAQIPQTISYQGLLQGAGGAPVADGSYDVTFALYNVSSGGSALYTEAHTGVSAIATTKGLFNVVLGSLTPLTLPFDAPYWLGITVGANPELTPRIQLTASPYALNARIASGQVVKSLNALHDDVTLAAGSNVSITPSANTLTIAASPGGLTIPFSASSSGPADAFNITTTGTGRAGVFNINNPATTVTALEGFNNGGNGVVGVTQSAANSVYGVDGEIVNSAAGTNTAGVRGFNQTLNANGSGVSGVHAGGGVGVFGSSQTGPGVFGQSLGTATGEYGVEGVLTNSTPGALAAGVAGFVNSVGSSNAVGVFGRHSGSGTGVYGLSAGGTAIYGEAQNTAANTRSIWGVLSGASSGTNSAAVYGEVQGTNTAAYGVYGLNLSSGYGVFGASTGGPGVYGVAYSAAGSVKGVWGVVDPTSAGPSSTGVLGENHSTTSFGIGVMGSQAGSGWGVNGTVAGAGIGVRAVASGAGGIGLSAMGTTAGQFFGNVTISGSLNVTGPVTKGGGSFKIDHPLDPANKYLSHSFVESPDMMNVYNGNVVLGADGAATVELPDYFEALNEEFRYQLTPIGAPGPNLYVAEEVRDNRFKIAGGAPGMKVSWQVTGIRHDKTAMAHRIVVEQPKTGTERGLYLDPQAYGLPVERGLGYAAAKLHEQPGGDVAANTSGRPK